MLSGACLPQVDFHLTQRTVGWKQPTAS